MTDSTTSNGAAVSADHRVSGSESGDGVPDVPLGSVSDSLGKRRLRVGGAGSPGC